MTTAFITHPDCLLHDMGAHHPERPDRLRAVNTALEKESFALLWRMEARKALKDEIALAHPVTYINWLEENSPLSGRKSLDGDTMMNESTFDAALFSTGGALLAVDEVMQGHAQNAFVATRPPGHHAERKTAMGFCFFGNVVVASRYAQKKYGVERVAIIDFDVHHGNGTQDLIWGDKSILFASTHEMPLYPGTGALNETGEYGQVVNCPMRAGDGGQEVMEAYLNKILPALENHAPDLIVLSAGFDAHFKDPLGNMEMRSEDFGQLTLRIKDFAAKKCKGRIVSCLEGGYDLDGLSASVSAHVKALMA